MSISFDQFKSVELRVARVIEARRVPDSNKLLCLTVLLGGEESSRRQIVAGVGESYEPEKLIGKNIVIVANLEPRTLMGVESQGMLLAASNESEGPVLLTTMEDISPGSEVR